MAPVTTRAVVLRGYDYGDSSRILRFYTEDHGVLSVVARGVRGRSAKGSAAVSSFATGELTAYVKENRELHTMKDFACNRARGGLGTDVLRFAGASAAVDLVLAHAEQERHVALFAALEHALDEITAIARPDLAGGILAGLWSIIGAFGFSPELDGCVRCGRPLTPEEVGRFDLGAGGIRCETCSHGAAGPRLGPITRGHVSTLLEGRAPVGLQYPRRHLGLVSDFVAHHVASRPLKSLGFLGGLLPADPEVTVDA